MLFNRCFSYSKISTRGIFNKAEKPGKVVRNRFIDQSRIDLYGGNGGNGCVSFERPKPSILKPDGGNGGTGGNVYFLTDPNLHTFSFDTPSYRAGNGSNGSSSNLTGKSGKDVTIRVPCGTVIHITYNNTTAGGDDTGIKLTKDDVAELKSLAQVSYYSDGSQANYDTLNTSSSSPSVEPIDLTEPNTSYLLARGGKGGFGNTSVPSTNLKHKTPGQLGEHVSVALTLKMICDVGLVGFPNVGKSALLSSITRAKSKIGNYPFTTLFPILGTVRYSDEVGVVVADLPGLVEGSCDYADDDDDIGKGLGSEFLRHVERSKCLLLVLDGSLSSKDMMTQFTTLISEIEKYNINLTTNKAIAIALNKIDLIDESNVKDKLKLIRRVVPGDVKVFGISALTGVGLRDLVMYLRVLVEHQAEVEGVHVGRRGNRDLSQMKRNM